MPDQGGGIGLILRLVNELRIKCIRPRQPGVFPAVDGAFACGILCALESVNYVVDFGESGIGQGIDRDRATVAGSAHDQNGVVLLESFLGSLDEFLILLHGIPFFCRIEAESAEEKGDIVAHGSMADKHVFFRRSAIEYLDFAFGRFPHAVGLSGRDVEASFGDFFGICRFVRCMRVGGRRQH